MVDLDKFKEFNDHYGHVKGDECLMSVADRLRGATRRPGELAARYGGEEFILLLTSTSESEAAKFGRWLCEDVRAMEYPHALGEGGWMSISVGLASVIPDDSLRPLDLLKRADSALYWAKGEGRNRHAVHAAV